jgi:hypothetical protein
LEPQDLGAAFVVLGSFPMKLKKTSTFKVWSNIFYLPAFVLAAYYGLWITAFFVAAVVFFGVKYHLSNEERFLWPDNTSAHLLIISNLYLCYASQFSAPYFWIALLFVCLGFFYYLFFQDKRQYSLNHGLWHMYGSLITIFCILAFVMR